MLFGVFGIIFTTLASMSLAVLVKKLLTLLSVGFNIFAVLGLVLLIVFLDSLKGIIIDHFMYYIHRLSFIIQQTYSITMFQHGISFRRCKHLKNNNNKVDMGLVSNVENGLSSSHNIIHSCGEENNLNNINSYLSFEHTPSSKCFEGSCASNPYHCPARCCKSPDLSARIYCITYIDCFYTTMLFESFIIMVQFLCSFVYGLILIYTNLKTNVFVILVSGISVIAAMIIIEVINSILLKYVYEHKDYRISKCNEIIGNLHHIKKTSLDDIGHDIITECRNNELKYIMFRFLLSFLNKILHTLPVYIALIIILDDYVNRFRAVESGGELSSIDAKDIATAIYILIKMMGTLPLFPQAIKVLAYSINSYIRLESFIQNSPPNFYIAETKFNKVYTKNSDNIINKENNHYELKMKKERNNFNYDTSSNIPLDSVEGKDLNSSCLVMFKNASFAWIHDKNKLMGGGYRCLKNTNFNLYPGNIAIITGSQGCGKTIFIKAILGDLTLVNGSMSVKPINEMMPIFYAPQDIWLKNDTIRANIIFGYIYNESIYNKVIKCVELESDFSSWCNGDLRRLSNNGCSLSGGQRVRIGMARAIYAYSIFSRMNRKNGYDFNFLVCLDATFNALDPFVAKSIFYNLFNTKNGLLNNVDVATVVTASKRVLDICTRNSANLSKNTVVYTIKDETLLKESSLEQFINSFDNFKSYNDDYSTYSTSEIHSSGSIDNSQINGRNIQDDKQNKNDMNSVTKINCNTKNMKRSKNHVPEFISLCECGLLRRDNRILSTKELYDDKVFTKTYNSSVSSSVNPYTIYFSSVGCLFVVFIFFIVSSAVLDSIKFVIASNMSDCINENSGTISPLNFQKMKEYGRWSYIMILNLTFIVTCLYVIGFVVLSIGSLNSSRRLHEYCIKSIFYNSSNIIKIKKSLSDVITFLSSDITLIDENLGYSVSSVLTIFIETTIRIFTLCYLIPLYIPICILITFVIFDYIFVYYVKAAKNLQLSTMDCVCKINTVCDEGVSGSVVYRSFNREWEFLHRFIEYNDYLFRCRFMSKCFHAWSAVNSNVIISVMNLFILVIPIFKSYYFRQPVRIGYYSLILSLCSNVSSTFAKFLFSFVRCEVVLCSLKRFGNFIPEGENFSFESRRNTNEEDVIINSYDAIKCSNLSNLSSSTCSMDNIEEMKANLIRRRKFEMKSQPLLNRVFNRLKVNFIDVTKYLSPEHIGVELVDVTIYSSPKMKKENVIIKNVTASAYSSEIIGLIGRTGAGKTTLLSVLHDSMRYKQGSVLLDGREISTLPASIKRNVIGILPQTSFVFNGWTLRRFLDPRMLYTDDDLYSALECCGLLEFVHSLPGDKGLDTIIMPENANKINGSKYKKMYCENSCSHKSCCKKLSSLVQETDLNFKVNSHVIDVLETQVDNRGNFNLVMDQSSIDSCADANCLNSDYLKNVNTGIKNGINADTVDKRTNKFEDFSGRDKKSQSHISSPHSNFLLSINKEYYNSIDINVTSSSNANSDSDLVLTNDSTTNKTLPSGNILEEDTKSPSINKTVVQSNNSNMILSNSQLRTLSFTRLILYRHLYRVILVDEPPSENCIQDGSNTDELEIGYPIYDLLSKYFQHCTIFITSHDANALKKCSSIWIMHNGSLIGTCKRSEIVFNESLSNIIEDNINKFKVKV